MIGHTIALLTACAFFTLATYSYMVKVEHYQHSPNFLILSKNKNKAPMKSSDVDKLASLFNTVPEKDGEPVILWEIKK